MTTKSPLLEQFTVTAAGICFKAYDTTMPRDGTRWKLVMKAEEKYEDSSRTPWMTVLDGVSLGKVVAYLQGSGIRIFDIDEE